MDAILMPQIGQDIPRGKIVEWLKREGDPVTRGDVVATVESEKAVFDVEADATGVLLKILFNGGDEAEVLKPIGYIGKPGEKPGEKPDTAPATPAPQPAAAAPAQQTAVKPGAKSPVSPVAKRMAAELGVDLSAITGTGPGGRISKEDVLAAAESGKKPGNAPPHGEGEVIEFTGMRKVIAERLSRSKQTIPHIYLFIDVDMENALAWRSAHNEKCDAHVTITDLIVHAAARGLREFPRLNGHVSDGALTVRKSIDVGVATATDDGLLVPVVRGANNLSIEALSAEIKRVVEAARGKKMDANLVGSFTVTSLGMFGVSGFIPIINPPECGILGVGAVEPRAVPHGSKVAVRRMMTVCLSADHRAIDGVYAAQFLGRLKKILEDEI